MLPFLMQMCANRKHCSSAWLSISVTPLCSGLSLVPLREMFPFKCYLSISFKTSSFLFDKQPGGMVGTGSLSKLFRDVEKWGERDVLQAPPSHIPAYVLLFPPALKRMSYSIAGRTVCSLLILPFSLRKYRCSLSKCTLLCALIPPVFVL